MHEGDATYMRLTRVQSSPTQLERIITNFREIVMPTAKQAKGYAGASLYLNVHRLRPPGIGHRVNALFSRVGEGAREEHAVRPVLSG